MGKRKGEWLSFMALLLVFMLTTLFFYMVYTMHYDSASDDFTGFTVFDYQSEPGAQVRTKLGTLREDLDDWARRNQAVVFYKGFSSAGIAALDYAGWFKKTWHTPFDGREAKTALIKKKMETCTPIRRAIRCFPERITITFSGNLMETAPPPSKVTHSFIIHWQILPICKGCCSRTWTAARAFLN